jgi:DNA-binding response OmpR family regulator
MNKYLLLLFISKPEILLTNLFLIEKLWWDSNICERNIRVSISRLKISLENYGIDNWIQNIRWEWYIIKK